MTTATADYYVVDWLEGRGRKVYSQNEEDGYIEAIFERIKPRSRVCFEVGAGDGITLSNTRHLREQGWSACLIEAQSRHQQSLKANALARDNVLHLEISDEIRLDDFLPHDVDFGSIDIDGEDFWIWAGMQECRPRVMCVEIAAPIATHGVRRPPPLEQIGSLNQAGLDYIVRLGQAKGYRHVATTRCNALLIREDEVWDGA